MTDKAEDVVARLKSWATGSYDVELASARINVRDVRDALALIEAQAAEIAALKAKLAHYTYKTDPYAPENKHQLDDMAEHIIAQAAEIAALKAVDAKVGAVLAEQDRDYAEKINRILERHAAQLVSQASEIAAHKLHIVKLYSKLENRAREFSPGDKS